MTCQWNVMDHGRPNVGRTMGHLGPFAHPKHHFGRMWVKPVVWPYLGLRGPHCISEGPCPRHNPPPPPPPQHTLFVVSTPQNGPNAPLEPGFGAHLPIWPNCIMCPMPMPQGSGPKLCVPYLPLALRSSVSTVFPNQKWHSYIFRQPGPNTAELDRGTGKLEEHRVGARCH